MPSEQLPHRRCLFLLLGLLSLLPTAGGFRCAKMVVSVRRRMPSIATATTTTTSTQLGFCSSPNFHDGGSCLLRGDRRREGLRLLQELPDALGSNGNIHCLGESRNLFAAHGRERRKQFGQRIRGNHNNNNHNHNNAADDDSHKRRETRQDNPLDRVRIFRQLPLRQACVVLCIYLSVGVIAYKGVFPEPSWSILDALYFSCVCLSTIGYGDLLPTTRGGKMFTALFGMSGILLWSSAIVTVGTSWIQSETAKNNAKLRRQRNHAVMAFYDQHLPKLLQRKKETVESNETTTTNDEAQSESMASPANVEATWPLVASAPPTTQECKQPPPQKGYEWIRLLLSLVQPLLVILSGGSLIGRLEGWGFCDSFYFSFVTAAAIGFGDYSPTTRAGRLLTILLIPVMMGAAGQFFARLGLRVVQNRTRQMFASPAERAEWLTQEQAHAMDLDGNGRVSKSEYVLYMLIEAGIVDTDEARLLEEQFDRFDVTRSGYIESGDLKAMKKFRKKLQRERRKGDRTVRNPNRKQLSLQ